MRIKNAGMVAVVAALGFVVSFAGCSKQTKSDPEPTSDKQTTEKSETESKAKTVVLYEYRFNPNSLNIEKGTEVTFKNKDQEKHNVKIGALDVDKNIDAGSSWSYEFKTTGEFAVGNRLSSKPMKMTIVVE